MKYPISLRIVAWLKLKKKLIENMDINTRIGYYSSIFELSWFVLMKLRIALSHSQIVDLPVMMIKLFSYTKLHQMDDLKHK